MGQLPFRNCRVLVLRQTRNGQRDMIADCFGEEVFAPVKKRASRGQKPIHAGPL